MSPRSWDLRRNYTRYDTAEDAFRGHGGKDFGVKMHELNAQVPEKCERLLNRPPRARYLETKDFHYFTSLEEINNWKFMEGFTPTWSSKPPEQIHWISKTPPLVEVWDIYRQFYEYASEYFNRIKREVAAASSKYGGITAITEIR